MKQPAIGEYAYLGADQKYPVTVLGCVGVSVRYIRKGTYLCVRHTRATFTTARVNGSGLYERTH
jgi:hypothetical protein